MSYALRTPLVLPLAAAVTVGLFLLMRALIDIGPVSFSDTPERVPVQIRVDVDPYEPDRTLEPDLVEVLTPPDLPDVSEVDRAIPSGEDIVPVSGLPPVGPGDIEVDPRPMAADGNPIPVVRLNPVYPDRLATRGVEGQCTLIFDIMPNGQTANVRILNCSNTGFETASVRAVERWRYSPQIRNGQPEVYRGATTQLIYRLDT